MFANHLRHFGLALLAIFLFSGIFFAVSFATTFSKWPWTVTEVHHSGMHNGYTIGATKLESLQVTVRQQHNGLVSILRIFESGATYAQQYRGNPATLDDLSSVSLYDDWHVGLTGCNCWLLLNFRDGTLYEITRKLYRGPTK